MKRLTICSIVTTITVLLSACNWRINQPELANLDVINTAAAQTVSAYSTQVASQQPPTQQATYTVLVDTATLNPTELRTATATPKNQTSSTPTKPTKPCAAAEFIADVTIPDGTPQLPGKTFTKKWKVKNTGTCKWDTNFTLVFGNEGNSMGGPASQPLGSMVEPEISVDISVDLIAPTTPGKYKGVWALRDNEGNVFGKFWVEIEVINSAPDSYSFVDNLCSAEWKSGAGVLDCPGKVENADGAVQRLDNPKLEGGKKENEPAILTIPQHVENGEISGSYPSFLVPAKSHFRAIIGCLYGNEQCSVIFTIKYRVDGGAEQQLSEWAESYDGTFTRVDIDLEANGLTGKLVAFILLVSANGSAEGDQAFWLNPSVKP